MTTRIWSSYQQALFRALTTHNDHVMVKAVAGSGKTTTLVEGFKQWVQVNPTKTGIFVCFNKLNADDLKTKVPNGVAAATFHSACFGAVMRQFKHIKLNNDKARDTARMIISTVALNGAEIRPAALELQQAYALIRNTMTSLNDVNALQKVFNDYEQEFEYQDLWGSKLQMYHMAMLSNTAQCTFDEMLTMVLDHNIPMKQYDMVAVDEAQDTNKLQQAIIHKMLKPSGRLVVIGDPWQSMYRFRGADSTAMGNIQESFAIKHDLPLSISYRCAKAIITRAQEFVPEIQARDDAPMGSVVDSLSKDERSMFTALVPSGPTMVVCRCNAPLVQHALALIRQNKKVIVRGKDIGKAILALCNKIIKSTRAANIDQLIRKLPSYAAMEVQKLTARDQSDKAAQFQDRIDTLQVILDDCQDFNQIEQRCDYLFSDTTPDNCITFSSIHRSKGLEADVVVWLYPQINYAFMDSANNPEVQQQEKNICYVAITRAKTKLIIQEQPPRK
jgi:superfamily I DNA/RNA helicase